MGSFSQLLASLLFLTACSHGPVRSAEALENGAGAKTNLTAGTSTSGAATPSPTAVELDASQRVQFPMTSAEKRKLPRDFKKALAEEVRSFDHQEKVAMKELAVSQNMAIRAWRNQEKKMRKAYFEQHESGPERRQYVQEYLVRKKAFDQNQKNELTAAKLEWKQKREALLQSQKDRETQFNSALNLDQRPAKSLWPLAP